MTDCGSGCLFDVDRDPRELMDLAEDSRCRRRLWIMGSVSQKHAILCVQHLATLRLDGHELPATS